LLLAQEVQKNSTRGVYYRVEQELGIHRSRVRYWWIKAIDPSFHPGKHGGNSQSTIKPYEIEIFYQCVIAFFRENPLAQVENLRADLVISFERKFSKTVVKRFLKSIGWSWKIPTNFHVDKYLVENIERYLIFMEWVQGQDPSKLKYCDESHVVARTLKTGRKVCGLRSQRVYTRDYNLHDPSVSVSIITSV